MALRILLSLCLVITLFAASSASAKVSGREVEYRVGDTVHKGYLAENTSLKGKRPLVLVVHERTFGDALHIFTIEEK